MNTYDVYILGTSSLPDINNQIEGEEAGASEFKSSEVVKENGSKKNKVTFSTLAAGKFPLLLIIVKQSDPKPDGTQKVWEGEMVMDGSQTPVKVIAYRTITS